MSEVHYVVTGPARGLVQLEDGTLVDVTPDVIQAESLEKAQEIGLHLIAVQHETAGTFGDDWQHTDCAHCGGK